jgi:hypothetical protein
MPLIVKWQGSKIPSPKSPVSLLHMTLTVGSPTMPELTSTVVNPSPVKPVVIKTKPTEKAKTTAKTTTEEKAKEKEMPNTVVVYLLNNDDIPIHDDEVTVLP